MNDLSETLSQAMKFKSIDHIAIAVKDLDQSVALFCNVLGFQLVAKRKISGNRTGMISAELVHNNIKFVLCQGTEPDSQVSLLVKNYGPGVAHIALAVDDIDRVEEDLCERGLNFDTSIIRGPGLNQIFSSRDSNTGLSFEFIERKGEVGFLEDNVQTLFEQLEKSGAY